MYTDIVEPQLVGDHFVQLLRCVPALGSADKLITLTYNKLHYVPVNKQHIDTITFEIKMDQNRNVSFRYGKAFVHNGSEECVKSELDLFELSPTQTSIEKSIYVEIPLSALSETAPLDFYIAGHGEDYIDLNNTLLHLTCKIVKEDGSDIDAAAKVALVNYLIASIFSQLDVTLGDQLISQSNNCYPYRALIELILNYGEGALKSQFTSGPFYKDTAEHHNIRDIGARNVGFTERAHFTTSSHKVELLGHLHSNLFFQEKLLNSIDLKIKLSRNKNSFCLMSGDADQNYKLLILNAALFVKRVKVAPGVRLGHAEALLKANVKYLIDRVGLKVFIIPAGTHVINQENLFLGQLPKLIVLGFVDNDAFSGNYAKNPFNFKHYDINFAALYVDGEQVPEKPLQPDFENGNCVIQATGKHLKDNALLVDRQEFYRGYMLLAFDLSPDQDCADHYSLIKTGNLRAKICFARALPHTVNMIVYGIFDNVIEINLRRNVLFDLS
uniref:Uncharacterized protein F54H12.2-like n=1 Tax=Geotrypetes seraphini TaxID=260995 RepID=A0A6P8QMR6_GEOSA|nr:uncharacterized protein F54H12.2-like [Geotrypetes seraphini]